MFKNIGKFLNFSGALSVSCLRGVGARRGGYAVENLFAICCSGNGLRAIFAKNI